MNTLFECKMVKTFYFYNSFSLLLLCYLLILSMPQVFEQSLFLFLAREQKYAYLLLSLESPPGGTIQATGFEPARDQGRSLRISKYGGSELRGLLLPFRNWSNWFIYICLHFLIRLIFLLLLAAASFPFFRFFFDRTFSNFWFSGSFSAFFAPRKSFPPSHLFMAKCLIYDMERGRSWPRIRVPEGFFCSLLNRLLGFRIAAQINHTGLI